MCALPGLPGISPRKLQKLLRSINLQALANLKLEEIPDVQRVEIQFRDGSRLVIENPVVAKISLAGMILFQIQTTESNIKKVEARAGLATPIAPAEPKIDIIVQQPTAQISASVPGQVQAETKPSEQKPLFTEEDIELVMQETGCSREEAIKALEETKGDIAEAILLIKSRKSQS